MSADSPRRSSRGIAAVVVPPQVVIDRTILDSAIGFINDVTLTNQTYTDPNDTIAWARFETAADISDPRFGEDWELEGNIAPPLLLILGYGIGVQVWAVPANGEAVEVLAWRHGVVTALRVLPTPSGVCSADDYGRADESSDAYAERRPLVAIVEGSTSGAGGQPQFCAVNFVSLKTGEQVKTIKFKNPVLDVLANRTSIVITFHERIAVFDARTLDDRMSITTCYPSPGINPNPVALGPRWLAYAEQKLMPSKRSGGGCDGEGVASYTATVLNVAKSFSKGLRELGEQVAAGLTGTNASGSNSKSSSFDSGNSVEAKQAGIISIMDIKTIIKDYSPTSGTTSSGQDPIVAHFVAHSEAIVAAEFDNSGMLLLTADKRGHDFHIFRVQPHPVGPSLAAVHHLYVLHRGDTTAKVQNITFSLDSRWVAVSTLRGTTHVFPITPYGGPMGVRTHTSLHVVNKMSRFHRSAGLTGDGRSSSPISHSESTTFVQSLQPYHNATLPPFSRPTVVAPLAQLRQPAALGTPPGSAAAAQSTKSSGAGGSVGSGGIGGSLASANVSHRQRHTSLSDDNGKPLSVCSIFAKSRSWLLDPPNAQREAPHRMQHKAVDSLFVMAGHGALIQYDLDTKLASNVAKEKICDDTPIELEVEAKAQWNLGRRNKDGSQEIFPPLTQDNWLIKDRAACMLLNDSQYLQYDQYEDFNNQEKEWVPQVEIVTHAGPHRRLWMGPQFVFKTYNTPSGSHCLNVEEDAVEICGVVAATRAASTQVAGASVTRSSPLNMPLSARSPAVMPITIESGSYSSIEQSPKLMDRFRHDHMDSDYVIAHGDTRLKQDLADAMRELPADTAGAVAAAHHSDTGGSRGFPPYDANAHYYAAYDNAPFYDALTDAHDAHYDDDHDQASSFDSMKTTTTMHRQHQHQFSMTETLANALPNLCSYETSSGYESLESLRTHPRHPYTHHQHQQQQQQQQHHHHYSAVEKIVNPLGTVTTVIAGFPTEVRKDILDEVVSQLAAEESVIHENCDESLFRPVVAIYMDENARRLGEEEARKLQELCKPPEAIGNKLKVPIIAKEKDAEISRKEKAKNSARKQQQQQRREQHQRQQQEQQEQIERDRVEQSKFAELSSLNRKSKEGNSAYKTVGKGEEEDICGVADEVEKNAAGKKLLLENKQQQQQQQVTEVKEKTKTDKITKTKFVDQQVCTNLISVPPSREKLTPKPKLAAEAEKSKVSDKLEVIETTTALTKPIETKRSSVKLEAPTERKNFKLEAATERKSVMLEAPIKDKSIKIEAPVESISTKLEAPVESLSAKIEKVARKTPEKISVKPKIELLEEEKPKVEVKTKVVENKKLSTKSPLKLVMDDVTATKEVTLKSTKLSKVVVEKAELEIKKSSSTKSEEISPKTPEQLGAKPKEEVKLLTEMKEHHKQVITMEELATQPKGISLATELKPTFKKTSTSQNVTPKTEKLAEKPKSSEETELPTSDINKLTAKLEETSITPQSKRRRGGVESDIVDDDAMKLVPKPKKPATEDSPADEEKSIEFKRMTPVHTRKQTATAKQTAKEDEPSIKDPLKTYTIQVVESQGPKTNRKDYECDYAEMKSQSKVDIKNNSAKSSPKRNVLSERMFQSGDVAVMPPPPHRIPPALPAREAEERKIKKPLPQPARKSNDDNVAEVITEQPKTRSSKKAIETPVKDAPPAVVAYVESSKKDTKSKLITEDVTDGMQKGATRTSPPLSVGATSSAWKTLSGADMINKNLLSGPSSTATNITAAQSYPSLGNINQLKTKKKSLLSEFEASAPATAEQIKKLLPDLPTPMKSSPEDFTKAAASGTSSGGAIVKNIPNTSSKKTKKQPPTSFDDFLLLETQPPLESLLKVGKNLNSNLRKVDPAEQQVEDTPLINLESPLQENPALERKITPSPRGFTEQNLVFALCGSLHYENETSATDKLESNISPTLSLTRSSSSALAGGEQSTADYKSLTDNDEQYLSLSSQDTTTTTGGSGNGNDRRSINKNVQKSSATTTSSSNSSSASEEIIVLEEKKMSKKQKRKKQQQMELEKQQKENFTENEADADEELRPLIWGAEKGQSGAEGGNCGSSGEICNLSFEDRILMQSSTNATTLFVNDDGDDQKPPPVDVLLESLRKLNARVSLSHNTTYTHHNSTTTDSEGPLPATTTTTASTSDESYLALHSVGAISTATNITPNKLKTKKMEHKINLIAAIEAATSSSTSSAEESGVEGGAGGRCLSDMDAPAVAAANQHHVSGMLPLTFHQHIHPTISGSSAAMAAQQSAAKKKTKRRKR